MSKRKSNRKKSFLEATFKDVLICKKNDLKPFIEIFIYKSENITQQNLGTLAGIFEITDNSQDSSYIVNYLVSIVKKEYCRQAKRGAIKSFEAALHKANLALAKLAEHENINWIGKFNAIALVVEKNNLHLAQVGDTRALFLRGKVLTDLNKNTSPVENPNPLKTFTDIISGRLEKNDKLIATTKGLFEIFSFEEIKRSALNFSSSEFIQFLRTALINELERAAVLIVETQEKVKEITKTTKRKSKINAFSQSSFSKAPTPQKISSDARKTEENISAREKQTIIKEIKNDLEKKKGEFIDKKTGHIYIRGDSFPQEKEVGLINFLKNTQAQVIAFLLAFKKIPHFIFYSIRSIKWPAQIFYFFKKKNKPEELEKPLEDQERKELTPERKKKFHLWLKKIVEKGAAGFSNLMVALKKICNYFSEKAPFQKQSIFSKTFPRFSKIKNIFSKFDYSQKLYAALAIMFLLIVPYFIIKITKRTPKGTPTPFQEETSNSSHHFLDDKNVTYLDNLNQIYSGENIISILNLNNQIFAISSNKIVDVVNHKNYDIPNNFGDIIKNCPMDDLNLIFILNKHNSILSWSPISKKFQSNQINFPPNANITLIKTYLTYLYALDKKNNQIYRYPRVQGGFGDKTNWLKDTLDIKQVSDMAINEDIFLAQSNNLIRLFRGKKQPFKIEKTTTPFQINKIYSHPDSQNIYILDKNNARIIKLNLNGNVVAQYHNNEIKNAIDFTVNENAHMIYITSKQNVKSFAI